MFIRCPFWLKNRKISLHSITRVWCASPSGPMAHLKALLPKWDILKNWESIKDAIGWAKLPEDLLLKIANQLGEEEVPSMEVLAAVEVDDVKHAMRALNVTALKKTRVNLFMNALRLKYDLPLLDYTKVPADADKQHAEKRKSM